MYKYCPRSPIFSQGHLTSQITMHLRLSCALILSLIVHTSASDLTGPAGLSAVSEQILDRVSGAEQELNSHAHSELIDGNYGDHVSQTTRVSDKTISRSPQRSDSSAEDSKDFEDISLIFQGRNGRAMLDNYPQFDTSTRQGPGELPIIDLINPSGENAENDYSSASEYSSSQYSYNDESNPADLAKSVSWSVVSGYCRTEPDRSAIVVNGFVEKGDHIESEFDNYEGDVDQETRALEMREAVNFCREHNVEVLIEMPPIANPDTQNKFLEDLKNGFSNSGLSGDSPLFSGIAWNSGNGDNPIQSAAALDMLKDSPLTVGSFSLLHPHQQSKIGGVFSQNVVRIIDFSTGRETEGMLEYLGPVGLGGLGGIRGSPVENGPPDFKFPTDFTTTGPDYKILEVGQADEEEIIEEETGPSSDDAAYISLIASLREEFASRNLSYFSSSVYVSINDRESVATMLTDTVRTGDASATPSTDSTPSTYATPSTFGMHVGVPMPVFANVSRCDDNGGCHNITINVTIQNCAAMGECSKLRTADGKRVCDDNGIPIHRHDAPAAPLPSVKSAITHEPTSPRGHVSSDEAAGDGVGPSTLQPSLHQDNGHGSHDGTGSSMQQPSSGSHPGEDNAIGSHPGKDKKIGSHDESAHDGASTPLLKTSPHSDAHKGTGSLDGTKPSQASLGPQIDGTDNKQPDDKAAAAHSPFPGARSGRGAEQSGRGPSTLSSALGSDQTGKSGKPDEVYEGSASRTVPELIAAVGVIVATIILV